MSITSKGKKACVILDNNQVVTKILVLQEVWELEGDMLLKFAVDVSEGTKLVQISTVDVLANTDYKAGDYLYFSKGTFKPSGIRFAFDDTNKAYDYYSEVRFLKDLDCSNLTSLFCTFGAWGNRAYSLRLATVIDVSYLNTSKVTSMSRAFRYCIAVKQLNVSHFDTSKVTDMHSMFDGCSSLTSLDVSNFDTSKVTDMYSMFSSCSSLTSLDVSNFDTSKVTAMGAMFNNCSSLTSLDVSSFDTSKVTYMGSMFRECNKVPVLNVSGFNTSSVTSMYYTFFGCNIVTALDVSKWVTNKVNDFCGMFGWCQKLESLDVSNFDLGIATDISNMFYQCQSLTNLIFGSKWGTQTSTEANALTLDLSTLGSEKSYKLTDETYNSMLTMYDRASNGLTTMTIKFNKRHNLPDGFAEKMSALGYTITLV